MEKYIIVGLGNKKNFEWFDEKRFYPDDERIWVN